VSRWTTNQSKDIASIAAHVSKFSTTIESLKSELNDERKKSKEASSRVASMKKEAAVERETSASMRQQYEAKLKVCHHYCHHYLRQGGYVFARLCLFVRLSLCVLAG